MASRQQRTDLQCSICLSIYTDPVTLRCGHNFCQACIDHVLNSQESSEGYFCPECKENFGKRPALKRNLTLRNIVKNYLSTQSDQEVNKAVCTQCIHSPVLAIRFCLLCEAFLCDSHLIVHSKAPEHVLSDPTTYLENRKCSRHMELLKYYCTRDTAFLCVSCRLDGAHQGHQVEMLDEASEKKKKKLRNDLQNLTEETEKAEKGIQSLQQCRTAEQGKADAEAQKVTGLIGDLRRQLEDLEKRVLSDVSRQAEQISRSYEDMIQRLKFRKEELSRKVRHIEELCALSDPLTVLQESDTEDEEENKERPDEQLHDGGHLDVASVSHTLHTGLSNIITGGISLQEAADL